MIESIKKVRFVTIAGILVFLLASAVLVGWLWNIGTLKSILDGYISMKFNTAVSFLLLSVCLIINSLTKKISPAVLTLELLVAVYALVSLSQEIFAVNLGIDELLYPDVDGFLKNEVYPGRMSPITAVLFAVMALSMFGQTMFKHLRLYFQYAFHFVSIISVICIVGYFFDVPSLYQFTFLTPIAIHTAIGFAILSIGAAALNPCLGVVKLFLERETGNIIAKKLFFRMMGLIIALTYIRLQLYKHNILTTSDGTIFSMKPSLALSSILFIIICFVFIYKAANAINQSERKQKLAELHFKSVIESAPNAFIISDETGTITLINEQTEKIFGYTKEELVGQKIDLLVPTKFRHCHPKNRHAYHSAPTVRYFGAGRDLHGMRKDGTEFPVEIGLNPLTTADSTLILASVIDITKRKEQEATINQQVLELQNKNEELEQFNYIASHDLQEPLRTVNNFIKIIEEDHGKELNPEIKLYLEHIDLATKRMSMLVRSLLDFARLGKNRQLVYIDCNDILKDVVSDLNGLISASGAEVRYGVMPHLYAYRLELRLVFQNLINNAIKFRKNDIPPIIKIHCHEEKNYYEFWVSDNGIGINPRYFERIFQIFKSLHKEGHFEGHGIGLAHCYKIVGLHMGKIWVESEPGEGSTFKFTISKFIDNNEQRSDEQAGKLHNAG